MSTFNGTRADLVRSLRLAVTVLKGQHPDALGIGQVFWGAIGNAVLEILREDYLRKLAGGVGIDGQKWKPLAESTLEKRRRKGREDEDILVESQRLVDSLMAGFGASPSGAPDQVFDIVPGGVTVGTDTPYADYHQEGRPPYLPARPIVPADGQIPPAYESRIQEAMEQAFAKVVEMVVANGGIT